MTNSECNYLTYSANNHWLSVDPHVQDQVESVSLSLWPIRTASTVLMYNQDQVTVQSPDLEDQKSFTLRWCLFLSDSKDVVPCIFAHIGSLYFQLGLQWTRLQSITWPTWQKIVDALLMVIFRIGQRVCRFLFGIYWLLRLHLWMSVTNCPANLPRCNTKHC